MTNVGERLRTERLEQKREIRVIAEELCIGSRYLEAIEAEEWEKLPGGFFNRSFVRQYAKSLGIDPDEFERDLPVALRHEPEAVAPPPSSSIPFRLSKSSIDVPPLSISGRSFFDRRTGMALVAMVVVAVGGAGLSLLWEKSKTTPPVVVSQAPPTPLPVSIATPPAAPETPSATVTAVPSTDGRVITLNISAKEKTWVEVVADGKKIFVGILEPGESKMVTGSQRTRMLVGNAGGVSVRKSGKDIGPIGPRGQVRVVSFTEGSFEITTPNSTE
jgi:cytoskeleton protein RodZ